MTAADRPPAAILPVEVTHAAVLRLSVPMMFAYLTTPLVGLVDTALVGQLGSAAMIGGVAIATVIFEVVLATLNFLRGGTTGLTAQAVGARDVLEERAIVLRATCLALGFGTLVVLLATPIATIGFGVFAAGGPEMAAAGRTYFDIRVWSAPMMLFNYVVLGWMLGRGEAATGLLLQLWLNGINIAASTWLVLGLGYGLAGAALGTVVAETAAALLGALLISRRLRNGARPSVARVFDLAAFRRMMGVNGDMMIRSFALLVGLSFFTQQGAAYGPVVLAANTVLMRFYLVGSAALDGIAMAAEQLAGQSVGARNRPAFHKVVRMTALWGFALAGVLSLVIFLAGPTMIDLLTISPDVRQAAREFMPYIVILPLLGVTAFQMDGIFIGATWSRDMRNMMLLSLAVYFASWAALTPFLGVHGLWISLLVFHGIRSLSFTQRMRQLVPATFPAA